MYKKSKLGSGTYGIVYSASMKGKDYAVKCNSKDRQVTNISSMREMDILTNLKGHPLVISMEYVSIGNPFIKGVMSPVVDEEQCHDSIHFIFEEANNDLLSHNQKKSLTFKEIVDYLCDILLALEYIHAMGYIHCDLKPGNILLFSKPVVEEEPGEGDESLDPSESKSESKEEPKPQIYEKAKICDLGLALPYCKIGKQTEKPVTLWYRAPEIILKQRYDFKSDLWSVGQILYEMLGTKPMLYDNDEDVSFQLMETIIDKHHVNLSDSLVKKIKSVYSGLNSNLKKKVRLSYIETSGITSSRLSELRSQGFNDIIFTDLLNGLLTFDPKNRLDATSALAHKFFDSKRDYINRIRSENKVINQFRYKIRLYQCAERLDVINFSNFLYSEKKNYDWYSDRILFQAIDLFDRYISSLMKDDPRRNNVINSKVQLFYDHKSAILYFLGCLYLSVKYFYVVVVPPSFDDIVKSINFRSIMTDYVSGMFTNDKSVSAIKKFESRILEACSYTIYRETCYELSGDYDGKVKISELLKFYGSLETHSNSNGAKVFSQFLDFKAAGIPLKSTSRSLRSVSSSVRGESKTSSSGKKGY